MTLLKRVLSALLIKRIHNLRLKALHNRLRHNAAYTGQQKAEAKRIGEETRRQQ